MPILLTVNSVDRVLGETNSCSFTIAWPAEFNATDGDRWRVCVRSFVMQSASSMDNTSWVELRLRLGGVRSYNTNAEHGVVTFITPISSGGAVSGQATEAWCDVQSLTPEISASLHDSDGGVLFFQAADKSIQSPGEWICQLEFHPCCT